jgi:UDP-glucose 4-epimerase
VRTVRSVACDLSSVGAVREAASVLESATAVVHLAAHVPLSTARNADKDTPATLAANVGGTAALLAALRDASRLETLVSASTFEVFGEPRTIPITEDHPPDPLNYYAASKLCGERYMQLAAEAHGRSCSILRLSTVHGPGDRLVRAIGNFVRNAAAGKPQEVHGGGYDRRDLAYVADTAAGVGSAIARRATGEYNIGGGSHSILELAEVVADAAGVPIIRRPQEKPERSCALDLRRAESELGWSPATSLADGIQAQLEWTRGGG